MLRIHTEFGSYGDTDHSMGFTSCEGKHFFLCKIGPGMSKHFDMVEISVPNTEVWPRIVMGKGDEDTVEGLS